MTTPAPPMPPGPLVLTKHHGLGNDFLVVLDGERRWVPFAGDLARRLCERRTGIGADGLIVATPGGEGADVVMHLRNADGSTAEMSGNGIRCLAQAVIDGGWVDGTVVAVATDAGPRVVTATAEVRPGLRSATVAMGTATVEEEGPALRVDLGNPHYVVRVDDPGTPGLLESFGRRHPDENVELVRVVEPDVVEMRVHERGVGETLACGTGACAVAVATNRWGLVGRVVTVRQRGGDAVVDLSGTEITLTGPTQTIARVEVAVP